MGVRTYRGQIVCDVRWPDGTRTIRVCANRTAAKNLRDRIKGSIADGSWRRLQEQLKLRERQAVSLQTFSETYLQDYARVRNKPRSYERKVTAFNSLNRHLGRLNLEGISPAVLHNYVRKRRKEKRSNGTINRELIIVKHLLEYAVECGVIDFHPAGRFRILKEDQQERPRFSDEEIQSVLGALRPECRPLYTFVYETGCRRGEAFALQHWQLQLGSKLVVFSEDTKSRRFRYVPLTDDAIVAVQALPRLRKCPYVFYNPKTKDRWHDCRKAWIEAREKAGLAKLQVKDLRRHFAIKLAESGADMHDIQQVLGHASVATTEKYYAQFSPRHSARKILRVLEGGKAEMETKRKHEPESSPQAGSEESPKQLKIKA